MSNFGPMPSRMFAKISPSLAPCVHSSSRRFGGCTSLGAIGPLPAASSPWQALQYL
jgi:hypothetical protein